MRPGDQVAVTSDTSPSGGYSFTETATFERMDPTHVYVKTHANGVTVGIPLLFVTRIEVAA